MPRIVKSYRGRIVKRMCRVPRGISLTLLHEEAGRPGEKVLITQRDWDEHGKTVVLDAPVRMEDLRQQSH